MNIGLRRMGLYGDKTKPGPLGSDSLLEAAWIRLSLSQASRDI